MSEKPATVAAILIRGQLTAAEEAAGIHHANDHFHATCTKEAMERYETVSTFLRVNLDAAEPHHCDVCGLAIS
jgi:hypothetical protein